MKTAALITPVAGQVLNVIVADASIDTPPAGYALVDVPNGTPVEAGHSWDARAGFKPAVQTALVDPVVVVDPVPVEPTP